MDEVKHPWLLLNNRCVYYLTVQLQYCYRSLNANYNNTDLEE